MNDRANSKHRNFEAPPTDKPTQSTLLDTTEIARYASNASNAKEILSEKARKHGTDYQNVKYVQMASGTAYNAVLMVADEFLKQKEGDKFVKPKSIENFKKRVAKYNKNFLKYLNRAYEQLHLLGY